MADEIEDKVDDVQAEKDFAEGFDKPTELTPENPAPKTEDEDEEDPKLGADDEGVEKKDPPDLEAPPADPALKTEPKPEFVQITKEQLARFEAAAEKSGTFETQLAKAFGTIGGMKQIVEQLQAKTPEGGVITIPDDAFAEMEDFPDIAKGMRSALEKTLKGVRGTGDTKAIVDPEVVNKIVMEGIKQREMETLVDTYPDWQDIVGAVDSADKANPDNAFRKWLGTKTADYQTKINGTHSASVLARAIDEFKTATKVVAPPPPKKEDPKKVVRQNRIAGAVQPRGDGNAPQPSKTAEDEFDAGYQQELRGG